MKKTLLFPALALVVSPFTFAEEGETDPTALAISAELGLLSTTGNNESTSLFTKISASHQLGQWHNKYSFDTLYKEDKVADANGDKATVKTADQFNLSAQGDYQFTETSAAFLFASYGNDEFGAYSEYTTIAAGYSMRLMHSDTMTLDANIGPGFAEGKTQDGNTESGFVSRVSAAFEWKLAKHAKFVQNLSIESAAFNTRTIAETALTSAINESMQMKFGFKYINDSDVAAGLEDTETETSATIVVNF
jgi:putative salt-induced outer membrane protein YdiY